MLSAALGDKKGVSVVSKASSLSLEFIHWCLLLDLCDHCRRVFAITAFSLHCLVSVLQLLDLCDHCRRVFAITAFSLHCLVSVLQSVHCLLLPQPIVYDHCVLSFLCCFFCRSSNSTVRSPGITALCYLLCLVALSRCSSHALPLLLKPLGAPRVFLLTHTHTLLPAANGCNSCDRCDRKFRSESVLAFTNWVVHFAVELSTGVYTQAFQLVLRSMLEGLAHSDKNRLWLLCVLSSIVRSDLNVQLRCASVASTSTVSFCILMYRT
jgi:hypothetical protein